MKKVLIFLLSLNLVLVSCIPAAPTATPTPQNDPLNTPWEDRSIYRSGLITAEQPVLDGMSGASIYHLEFNIADDLYHVTGHEAESFNAVLNEYTEQLTWKIATPVFLQRLAEKHCSCDLDPLFQEWVYPQ
jgi:hypothetical protein